MVISFFKTVQSFGQFIWNWILQGGQLLDQNTANMRAEICAVCHNNKPTDEVRGAACCGGNRIASAAIDAVRTTIIKNHSTPSDAKLKVCGICGCDNRISVWIPNQILLKLEDANAYPGFCWKKKIQENLEV